MDTKTFRCAWISVDLSGELGGWELLFREETLEENLSILHFTLQAEQEQTPPKLTLSFRWPQKDIQVRWTPGLPAIHHLFPYWWNGGWIRSGLCCNAPVFVYLNLEGENRLAYACSEASETVLTHTGPTEESVIINTLALFQDSCLPVSRRAFSIRIDRRAIHYSEVLSGISQWYEELYPPLPVPKEARFPLYSTWYQFQREVTAEYLERELAEAAECGLKTVILDDGWNCTGPTIPGTFAHAGDWKAAPEKFPDMPGHIRKAHALGLRYLVWFPVPYIGNQAGNDFARFREKFLFRKADCGILDPRFPEVRAYLEEQYERFVREWDLDGLKLDFLDAFQLPESDPAAAEKNSGRDFRSLPDAVSELLRSIAARLRRIKPDILIEFRQKYIGPAMRPFCNLFRGADCAMDLLENRVRTIDLRLLSGGTAVHSDMLIWPVEDTPETAALQILNVIFSTPQISCMLTALPPDHRKMLKFWMDFCLRHLPTLQESPLRPEHPELSYPLVTAFGKEETITAVYLTGMIVPLHSGKPHIILNATHSGELLIDAEKPLSLRCFNVFGEEITSTVLSAGINRIKVPPSGFVLCG